jgi:hypothetical protein
MKASETTMDTSCVESGVGAPYLDLTPLTADPGEPVTVLLSPIGAVNSLAVTTPPRCGVAILDGNSLTYTPSAGFSDIDKFELTAVGPEGTWTGRVEVLVASSNKAREQVNQDAEPYVAAVHLNSIATEWFGSEWPRVLGQFPTTSSARLAAIQAAAKAGEEHPDASDVIWTISNHLEEIVLRLSER